MTRTLLLCTVLLSGCGLLGSVEAPQACATSAECPAGQTCADTGSSHVCWADAAPPVVTGVAVRCPAPCLRDGLLTVEARVTDDQEVGPVTVELDLDGGAREVAMDRVAGSLHRATLDLSEWPVPGLTAKVTATVRARDGARNPASATAPAGERPTVTRVVPGVVLGTTPTAPALLPDGTVVAGGSDGRLHFVDALTLAARASTVAFGPSVAQPPTIGRAAIWVASSNNRLYAASLDGGAILNGAGYDAGGTIVGPAAVTAGVPTASAPELAFVASAGGRMTSLKADVTLGGFVAQSMPLAQGAYVAGPLLTSDTEARLVSGTSVPALATLRFFNHASAFEETSALAVGSALTAPLAAAADGGPWSASADLNQATLRRTNPDGTPGPTVALGGNPGGGPVVLSNGDVAICVGNELRRYTPAGTLAWAAPALLDGAGLTPMVLSGPGDETTLLVPTRSGTVVAVRASDGALRWSASLTVNVELREGTVRATPGARTSTAWFTSADGLLHGLVVDGSLDAAAPWPKAWHDARNTGNLAARP